MTLIPKKTRVAVMYGGKSGEHEISLLSAHSVMTNLDRDRYELIPIGIDKTGQWYRNTFDEIHDRENNTLRIKHHSSKPISHLTLEDCDIIFPVLHGPLYEDGCIQGQLELMGLPYVGS